MESGKSQACLTSKLGRLCIPTHRALFSPLWFLSPLSHFLVALSFFPVAQVDPANAAVLIGAREPLSHGPVDTPAAASGDDAA